MRKILLNIAKIAVTSLLFYFILRDQDLAEIGQTMLQADIVLLIISLLVFIFVFLIFAIRWSLVNSIYGIHMPYIDLVKDYLIAFALNNVLPSSVGGDVWRMKQLKDVSESKSKSIMIPIIERISGFVAVILIAPLSFVYFTKYDISKPFIALFVIILFLLVFLFSGKFLVFIDGIIQRKASGKWLKNWQSLRSVFELIQKKRVIFSIAVLLSALTQCIYALSSKLILSSINVEIHYFEMLSIIPLIYVVTIIPISINGLGIREKFMTDAFIHLNTTAELAIAGAFLISLKQIIVGLIGAIIILFTKKKKSV